MTIKTLKNLIEKQGATLNKDGKAVDFSSGFQVSKKDCFILELKNINEILKNINGLLKEIRQNEFVGLWVENGKIYIDISIKIDDLKNAVKFGKEKNQLSIFNWSTKNCIYL